MKPPPFSQLTAGFAIVLLAQTGCWSRFAGGPAISMNRGTGAAALNAEMGFSDKTDNEPRPLPIAAVRTKFSSAAAEGALALGVVYCGDRLSVVGVCIIGGLNVVQFGVVDGSGSFGMLGPFLEAPIVFQIGKGFAMTLGPGVQYDIRFTTRSEGFATINVGLAFSSFFQHERADK